MKTTKLNSSFIVMETFKFSPKTNFPLWMKLHAPTLTVTETVNVIREFLFLENVSQLLMAIRKKNSLSDTERTGRCKCITCIDKYQLKRKKESRND